MRATRRRNRKKRGVEGMEGKLKEYDLRLILVVSREQNELIGEFKMAMG